MTKMLLPVDGSENALRATRRLVESLGCYKEPPVIDLLAVHLPVPHFPNMSLFVSEEMIERYYADECAEMLAPSRRALDAAGVKYSVRTAVGPIAETIVDQASKLGSNVIWMGTRGLSGLSSMVLGSVAMRVLHLAHIPVTLIR